MQCNRTTYTQPFIRFGCLLTNSVSLSLYIRLLGVFDRVKISMFVCSKKVALSGAYLCMALPVSRYYVCIRDTCCQTSQPVCMLHCTYMLPELIYVFFVYNLAQSLHEFKASNNRIARWLYFTYTF